MLTSLSLFAVACKSSFLGLIPWYQYLTLKTNCDINGFTLFPHGAQKSDVLLILAAIIDDLLRIAGLVALTFVIIGAINFMTSEGNSENAARARSTIINALAGLALSVSAALIVNFLGTTLGG